jgi:putative phosphoesterase
MKIGIISDIHANLIALEKVMGKLEKCDEIICAGDVVGYYPYSNEVVELLRKERVHSVLGNHDYAVLTGDFRDMNTYARVSASYTIKNLKEENREWLENLPLKIETDYFNVYHGIPSGDLDAFKVYIFPEFPLIEKILEEEGKSIVVGHTHIQFQKESGNLSLVNPGSVGQPRDGDKKAAYAIFDTEKNRFDFGRVEYDVYEVIMEIEKSGLPTALGMRLLEGI